MMTFLDPEYDGMQAEEAFGQICVLLKPPGSTKCVNQRILKTLHKTCEAIVERMVRFHVLMAQALVALLEQLKLNPTHSLQKTSPVYG